jgi:hypothetical protein
MLQRFGSPIIILNLVKVWYAHQTCWATFSSVPRGLESYTLPVPRGETWRFSCYDTLLYQSFCSLTSDSMWPLPYVPGRISSSFKGERVVQCIRLLISLCALRTHEISALVSGQLGEGSMKIKLPQPRFDSYISLDSLLASQFPASLSEYANWSPYLLYMSGHTGQRERMKSRETTQ